SPGPAALVNAAPAPGRSWDYYLVPLLANASTVIGFVELAADDGSFEGIQVLARPRPFSPVTRTTAAHLAQGALVAGERVTAGRLTWAPGRASPGGSPSRPYYEFDVLGATGTPAGTVRVRRDDGARSRGR